MTTPHRQDDGLQSPREYLKLKYMGDCKCGDCQLVPAAVLAAWADIFDRATPASRDGAEADQMETAEWNNGCDFAMRQLCAFLGVDPHYVSWDAATETVDGDVRAVIGNILHAKFGEDWSPAAPPKPAPDALRTLVARFPEINLGNYNDDDVEALNNWGLEIVAALSLAPVPPADGVGDDDPVLLRCQHCNRASWARRGDLPEPQYANTVTGTWLRCGHKDCDKPISIPDNPGRTLPRVALAPEAQMLEYARRLNDIATTCQMDGREGDANDLWRIAKQIVASSPLRGEREALVPPVKQIEMVDYSKGYKEKVEPMWRVEVNGVTADFPTESWANNFRNAILSLQSGVAALSPTSGAGDGK